MVSENRDIFQINSAVRENFLTAQPAQKQKQDSNFFLSEEAPHLKSASEPTRRLNDYDSNLLKEDAYKDITDDVFKLEYKISKTQENMKIVENQIQSAKDIGDTELVKKLTGQLIILREDLEALSAVYNDKSVSAKITGNLASLIGGKFKGKLDKIAKTFTDKLESVSEKMPKQLASIIEIKKSLARLENINKSVDELLKLNTPYGENFDKYDQLSKYIIKANSIQAEISRHLKK